MSELKEFELNVSGRVQGVNFRKNIQQFTLEKGLRGYVQNKDNGMVFIVAQGNSAQLKELISWIKSSPQFTKVSNVNVEWKEPKAKYAGFEIIRDDAFLIDKAKSLLSLGKAMIGTEEVEKIPVHVAIIPDGNRRWAREKGLHATFGHYTSASYEHIIELFHEAQRLGIRYLSLWGFSTENWSRDDKEIKAIFNLILKNIGKFRVEANQHKIRFRHLGRKDRLPKKLMQALCALEEETKNYDAFHVQLCLDYGGRDEIIRTVQTLMQNKVKKIDERVLSEHLDTAEIPDPDLVIRTSGEKRTSGFMPFQAAYAELYFSDVYFPDFDAQELKKAVAEFGKRIRRFGGTAQEDLQQHE